MGTGVEQQPVNDNHPWAIRGPDAEGIVWLDWNDPPQESFRLGHVAEVAEAVADFLARVDYGE